MTGDSGSGANLGDFKARAHGIGPVVSFIKKTDAAQMNMSLTWLKEFDNKNRLEGDILWIKFVGSF